MTMGKEELFYGVSIAIDKDLCSGCNACIEVCPPQILMIDKTTKKVRTTNAEACTGCAECINNCSNEALKLIITDSNRLTV